MILDAIFHNGRIHTMDRDRPTATSLGMINGRIAGLDGELDGLSARRTVNLGGATVVPGFNDAHHHLSMRGQRLRALDLMDGQVGTLDELYEAVRTFAAELPDGAWVRGSGYDQNKIGSHPTAEDLDRVSGGRPVFLEHVSGHMGVANTAAFERAGFSGRQGVPDVDGGHVPRDSAGAAHGLLQERAMSLVTDAFRPLDLEEIIKNIAEASRVGLSEGLTSATEPGIGTIAGIGNSPLDLHAFQLARETGALGLRMTLMPYITALHDVDSGNGNTLGRGLDLGLRSGFGDEWLRIGPVKILADGSLIGRSAAMHDCYHGEDHNKGFMQYEAGELETLLLGAHRNGWQLALHAIGDAAVDHALDLFETAQRDCPREDPRFRIEHFAVASDQQISRAAGLGVIAVPQGRFITELGDGMIAALGEERSAHLYRMRSLLNAGMVLPGSTDSPVVDGSPLKNIHDMVNRRTANGQLVAPQEALTVEQAVYASTVGSAYAVREEHLKGSLSRGKLADFVVLSDDLFTVPPENIAEITVGATVVGGEVAFDAGVLAGSSR
ncbi:amidohydrolase [Arthrobacter sp. MI7-26]|uniref:amidohydrolase n=1 Tax=Arthrobacter sp. MI7-26 TaxID=2993653 RepID=UPI002248D6A5|nr:amidohydrolase [Arthrobacter sp. MI7-26]MCX2746862.1 amidohydrolase [Arthrobacter sp. MI7-26]